MLQYLVLRCFSATHFKDACKLLLVLLLLFDEIYIGLLNDINRIAEHLDTPFDLCDRLSNVVDVCVAGLAARLSVDLLEARQVQQSVLQLLQIQLKLMGASITYLLDLEELLQELIRHGSDYFIQEEVLVDSVQL